MPEYFIGIDSGTQSTKAIVVDARNGRVVGAAAKAYGLIGKLPPGHKEQNPKVWIDAVIATVRSALKKAKVKAADVRGIGVSGQQHGFVPLDAAGNVIRPAKLWCDTSTAPQCEEIIGKLGGLARVIELIGNGVPAGFTASKILWLKQNEPENYAKLAAVLLPHDYINFWLTGHKTMEWGDASGTALMDVRTRTWSEAVVNAIDPDLKSKLPLIQSSDQPAGKLRTEAAKLLGLTTDVLVSAGGGDNMMGAIGTGNTRPGIVTASFGTSGTIYAYGTKPVVDPNGEIAAFCSSTGGWLPLLCTMNVTLVTELFRNLFNWDHAALEQAVAAAPAGAGGLSLLPYFDGERTPNLPKGTGVLSGLNRHTLTPGTLARAAMEGVTMNLNYGLRRLTTLGIKPREIRVTGGGARSAVWRQMMADIFGVPVVAMVEDEGAALGGALQAAWCVALGEGRRAKLIDFTTGVVALNESTRCRPDPKRKSLYRELQQKHEGFSRLVRPSFGAK